VSRSRGGKRKAKAMMQTMQGMGGMMTGAMSLVWILVVVALGLSIAALIKYLRQ
jgi:hypothetical protein